jgi:hypothetical protein
MRFFLATGGAFTARLAAAEIGSGESGCDLGAIAAGSVDYQIYQINQFQ